mgnify:CR=1 FL=1
MEAMKENLLDMSYKAAAGEEAVREVRKGSGTWKYNLMIWNKRI